MVFKKPIPNKVKTQEFGSYLRLKIVYIKYVVYIKKSKSDDSSFHVLIKSWYIYTNVGLYLILTENKLHNQEVQDWRNHLVTLMTLEIRTRKTTGFQGSLFKDVYMSSWVTQNNNLEQVNSRLMRSHGNLSTKIPK